MEDFVLNISIDATDNALSDARKLLGIIHNYAQLRKRKPTLDMFVPCVDGVPVKKPADDDYSFYAHINLSVQEEYQQALGNVLFEGFEVDYHGTFYSVCNGDLSIRFKDGKIYMEDKIHTLSSLAPYKLKLTDKIKEIYE
jgi:hypothetical protein